MPLNEKISRLPFRALFAVLSAMVVWDFLFTYFALKSNPSVMESNPINLFLSMVFGLEYFIFSIPLVLILLFAAIKAAAWLLRRIRFTRELKGENHIALLGILVDLPNIFHQMAQFFFGVTLVADWGFKYTFPITISIIAVYFAALECDLWKMGKAKQAKEKQK